MSPDTHLLKIRAQKLSLLVMQVRPARSQMKLPLTKVKVRFLQVSRGVSETARGFECCNKGSDDKGCESGDHLLNTSFEQTPRRV